MKDRPPANPLLRAVRILGLFLLLFLSARILLFFLFPESFRHLSGSQIAYAFLRGEQFDLSIILTVIGAPLALMLLPLRWARGRVWQGVWGWVCYAALVIFVLLFTADLILFDQQGKHLGAEITIADHDAGDSLELAFTRYTLPVAAGIAGLLVFFFLWRGMLRRPVRAPARPVREIAILVVALPLVFFVARGSVSEERLRVGQAHLGLPAGGGKLVMSGPFKAIHNLAALGHPDVRYYPFDEAVAEVRGLLLSPGEQIRDPEFPLHRVRRRESEPAARPNVVVIMLEGWPATAVDALREGMGLRPLGLTPGFDRIAKEGRLFTRFFAVGRRTRHGLASFLAGMPSLPVLPYLGKGLAQMRLSFLGGMAREEGYETHYFSGASRTSQGQHRIAEQAGFTHRIFAEDLPGDERKAWDHDLWEEVAGRLKGAREPFLAFVHTACTHAPYRWPRPEWDRFPDDTRTGRFQNALSYADDAMGRFFEEAGRESYYGRTIFIIASDHTQRGVESPGDPSGEFHVPCLVIGPGVSPGTDDRVGSQVDAIPTIVDLAGWAAPHAALGRSLFDDTVGADRGAVCTSDELVLRVEAGGWVLHNLAGRIDAASTGDGVDLDAVEHRLLSHVQVTFLLWARDRLSPGK